MGEWKDGVFVKERKYDYIEKAPKPKSPADLEIANISFSDNLGNNNHVLDTNEKGEIKFTLSNQGKGDAYNMVIEIKDVNAVKGIAYEPRQTVPRLQSGKEINIKFPISGKGDLANGYANFSIRVSEGNGSDSETFYVNFKTQGKTL